MAGGGREVMKYDRDLRRVRIIAKVLVAGNLGAAIVNLFAHNWTVAIACVIWVYSAFLIIQDYGVSPGNAGPRPGDRGRRPLPGERLNGTTALQ
jgi:hypothetical protein